MKRNKLLPTWTTFSPRTVMQQQNSYRTLSSSLVLRRPDGFPRLSFVSISSVRYLPGFSRGKRQKNHFTTIDLRTCTNLCFGENFVVALCRTRSIMTPRTGRHITAPSVVVLFSCSVFTGHMIMVFLPPLRTIAAPPAPKTMSIHNKQWEQNYDTQQ